MHWKSIIIIQNQYQKMDVLSTARANHNKENQTGEHHKQLQRLRVELNDRIFEVHKLTEDHAQEKAKIYIQLQKEKQQYTKTIKELRDKIKEDNEGWVKMIDELRKEKEDSIAKLKEDIQHKIHSQAHQTIQENEEKCNREIRELNRKMAQQEQSHRKRQEDLAREAKASNEALVHNFRKLEAERQKKHKTSLHELKVEYEANLTKIQGMFVQEESMRLQVQTDYQNAIKSHVRQKIIWETVQSDMSKEIAKLQEEIAKKSKQISELNEEIRHIQHKFQKDLQMVNASFQAKLHKLYEEHEALQKENCYRYSNQIQILKTEIDKLIQVHAKKEQTWLQSGKMVLQLYEKRQSKKEDVKAIQQLEVQLIKKDFLIQRERKQLKNCKLELENMEEIYDRIFIFNSNLNRSKTKSYQIKKLKSSAQINQSNRSTIISDKVPQKRYQQKSE